MNVAIIGAGFVADFYMRSLRTMPEVRVAAVWDVKTERLGAFCRYWGLTPASGLADILARRPDLVLNLTNPEAHFEVTKACLEAGLSVYSEKPLATKFQDAVALHALAAQNGLALASAPCSFLGETAQAAWKALRDGAIGTPRLVYAEIDDGFITGAPYAKWRSESGAPWPAQDEFAVGCTLEHAGYYLTWLIAMFGSVSKVVSASANALDLKLADGSPAAPNYASASLFFESGMVARLTCTIIASHDRSLRIFGDEGVLEVDDCWSNDAAVRVRRRHVLRRRLVESPFTRRVRVRGPTHPKLPRRGSTAMNFALGPYEMLSARASGRPSRLNADLALHLTEVTLAIQDAGSDGGSKAIVSRAPEAVPMTWAT